MCGTGGSISGDQIKTIRELPAAAEGIVHAADA